MWLLTDESVNVKRFVRFKIVLENCVLPKFSSIFLDLLLSSIFIKYSIWIQIWDYNTAIMAWIKHGKTKITKRNSCSILFMAIPEHFILIISQQYIKNFSKWSPQSFHDSVRQWYRNDMIITRMKTHKHNYGVMLYKCLLERLLGRQLHWIVKIYKYCKEVCITDTLKFPK